MESSMPVHPWNTSAVVIVNDMVEFASLGKSSIVARAAAKWVARSKMLEKLSVQSLWVLASVCNSLHIRGFFFWNSPTTISECRAGDCEWRENTSPDAAHTMIFLIAHRVSHLTFHPCTSIGSRLKVCWIKSAWVSCVVLLFLTDRRRNRGSLACEWRERTPHETQHTQWIFLVAHRVSQLFHISISSNAPALARQHVCRVFNNHSSTFRLVGTSWASLSVNLLFLMDWNTNRGSLPHIIQMQEAIQAEEAVGAPSNFSFRNVGEESQESETLDVFWSTTSRRMEPVPTVFCQRNLWKIWTNSSLSHS